MYIKVIVSAGAKKEKFVKKSEDIFEIAVKEKAERNMANKRVVELVSENLLIPKGKIKIINGHHHPHKLISISE
ncbi:MAG: DUF167 domain-containing protein [Minisyncoccia bacterium]